MFKHVITLKNPLNFIKMSLKNIELNSERIKDTLNALKNELKVLKNQYNTMLTRELVEENAKLIIAVENAKEKLIKLETQAGVLQVPLPVRGVSLKPPATETIPENEGQKPSEKTKKVKETKTKKPAGKESQEKPELPIDFGRLDLRIGHVVHVEKHPEADSLYLLKVECGEPNPRTVCSGLVKHVPIENLKNIHVVLLCNLKPVKMRGIMSEAMVMCASCEDGVEVLQPPSGCRLGEPVNCEGYTRNPDTPVMNPKKKIFETVQPDLHTNEQGLACYKGKLWRVEAGEIRSKTLKNVPIK